MVGSEELYREWQESGVCEVDGRQVSFELIRDAMNHAKYPFIKKPAYVVHGQNNAVFSIDNTVAWVRGASINMRDGRLGHDTGEAAMERRLLEVNAGQGLEGCLKMIEVKMLEFWGLLGASAIVPEADLEKFGPESYARGHGFNFEVYDNYLKSFEEDEDSEESKAVDN
uniref:Uncharacterized protein n=2 Tax=Pyramimonas obovata TaxID=1411642 RepID=A0A7S0WKJ0_9CHLO|mmetsp:Transcript_28659/g.62764  ORF Transcript_28659/g.62764 Transcript_28659/m.62764 type:complete len:169 (+) Transcript_28659:17-523(+)